MAHFATTLEMRKTTPHEWLRFGADVGRLVNDWSFRTDLVVNLGEETSAPAPALFNPATAEIEINTKVAFGAGVSAGDIGDITKRRTQLEYAKGAGAIFHEALHARFTRWSLEDAYKALTPDVYQALHNLEEGRIEAFGVRTSPERQVLLRACAMGIVIGDLENHISKIANVRGAGLLAALTLARVDAGVLKQSDIEPVIPILEGILGVEVLAKLREVWIQFQAHDIHNNATELYALAEKWVKILDETSIEKGEPQGEFPPIICGYPSPSGSGTPTPTGGSSPTPTPTPSPTGEDESESEPESGEGEGESESEGEGESETGKPESGEGESESEGEGESLSPLEQMIQDALNESKDNVDVSNQSDLDDALTQEDWKEATEQRESRAKDKSTSEKIAQKVFSKTSGPGDDSGTNSRLIETRKPTSDERISAVRVAKALEKAKYRERDVIEVNSVLPPGRLRTRALVQGQAQKARGVHTPVDAWSRTIRRMTDEPTLTIGVAVDISGSMGGAMNPMATTAWVLSEAGRRVQAKTAMVYFGNSVFPTLKAGQHLEDVKVYSAQDGTEEAVEAFKALDGSLDLMYGKGARLMVVVSDGYYRHEIRGEVRDFIRKCHDNGVAVLWLTFDNGGSARGYLEGTDAQLVCATTEQSASEIATIIGQASATALEKVGKRNG